MEKEVIVNTKYDKCSDPMYASLLYSTEVSLRYFWWDLNCKKLIKTDLDFIVLIEIPFDKILSGVMKSGSGSLYPLIYISIPNSLRAYIKIFVGILYFFNEGGCIPDRQARKGLDAARLCKKVGCWKVIISVADPFHFNTDPRIRFVEKRIWIRPKIGKISYEYTKNDLLLYKHWKY